MCGHEGAWGEDDLDQWSLGRRGRLWRRQASRQRPGSIWERFRPYKKHAREEVYMAAGHALRKKVQFAKDEDLHDILDYWKGVSAQQKL